MQNAAEVWKNETAGMRWVKVTDRLGKGQARVVQAGKVFTITPFDRQINQDSFATPQQDLFRNGTFVLVKSAEDTIMDEIESPDSLTESEVQSIVYDILAKKTTGERAIRDINSPIALNRILTALVLEEDAPNSAVDAVKTKHAKMEGGTPVATERVVVSPAPEPDKVETPRDGIPTVETPDFVQTEPEKVG
jgi:hypothetical protein